MAQAANKFTEETRCAILRTLRAGNYAVVAAQFAGISASTFYRWLRRGKAEPTGEYGQFRVDVMQALALAETRAVAHIVKRFDDDWRSAMAYLERKFPRRWCKGRTPRDAAGKFSHWPAVVAGSPRTPSETAEIVRLLLESGALAAAALPGQDDSATETVP